MVAKSFGERLMKRILFTAFAPVFLAGGGVWLLFVLRLDSKHAVRCEEEKENG